MIDFINPQNRYTMKPKHFIVALLSVVSLHCGQASAQTDFYSLSKKEKEARAEELLKMDFDTMMLDAKTMQAYNTELKRFGIYYQKKSEKQNSRVLWEGIGSVMGLCFGPALCIAWVPLGIAVTAGSVYFFVDWIVQMSKDRASDYDAMSKKFFEKANDVIPDISQ